MKHAHKQQSASRSRIIAAALVALALIVTFVLVFDAPWRSQTALTPEASSPSAQERAEDELMSVATPTSRFEEKSETAVENSAAQDEQVISAAPTHGRVHGTVFDDTGTAIKGAWVWTDVASGDRRSAKSNADGHYEIDGIPFGTRKLKAFADSQHEGEQTLLFSAATPDLEHDFYLRKLQRIRVRLISSTGASAFEAALVQSGFNSMTWHMVPVATREDPGATFDGVKGSLNDRFGIGTFWETHAPGLEPLTPDEYGSVSLHEDGPAWLSLVIAHQVIRKQRVDPSTEVVTFVLDPADILALKAGLRGRVVDESGAAIASTCCVADAPFRAQNPQRNVEGDFLLKDLRPGSRYLVVNAPERAEIVLPVNLQPGEVLDVGVLTLQRPIELSGRVVDASGKPVAATVEWGKLDNGSVAIAWMPQGKTNSNAEGKFSISGLAPAVWLVSVPGTPSRGAKPRDTRLASLPSRIDARDGSVTDIELVVRETGALLLVTELTEEPWPHIQALDKFGLPAGGTWLGRWNVETPLLLPPGIYELIVTRAGNEIERRKVEVDENPKRLEFVFEPVHK